MQSDYRHIHNTLMRNQCYCLAVCSVVAISYRIPYQQLLSPRRLQANIALARQTAMYLIHVVLGLSHKDVARLFKRDRTTVSYACRIVEDLREVPVEDFRLDILEKSIKIQCLDISPARFHHE